MSGPKWPRVVSCVVLGKGGLMSSPWVRGGVL